MGMSRSATAAHEAALAALPSGSAHPPAVAVAAATTFAAAAAPLTPTPATPGLSFPVSTAARATTHSKSVRRRLQTLLGIAILLRITEVHLHATHRAIFRLVQALEHVWLVCGWRHLGMSGGIASTHPVPKYAASATAANRRA